MTGPVRVLVVDDSAFMRHTIATKLLDEPDIVVVDVARDGLEAVEKVGRLRPDVVTLDVEMPRMDGLAALRRMMEACPCRVIMLSSATAAGADATIHALELGAVDFVAKPSAAPSLDIALVREELLAKIRHAARLPVVDLQPLVRPLPPRQSDAPRAPLLGKSQPVVVVGSSTGGPKALYAVVPALPADLPAAVLLIQHMPAGFTRPLADRLNELSRIRVKEAEEGEPLHAGVALLAPGDYHLQVTMAGRVHLDQGPRVHGVRPSVDVTMASLARHYGPRCLGVVLTGMGSDGTHGSRLIHEAGGMVVAEHESTCVVYGMPRRVVEAGVADYVVPLGEVSPAIAALLGSEVSVGG